MDDKKRIALVETKTVDANATALVVSPRQRYELEDHIGSAIMEVDEAANVISYEEYFPFGASAFAAGDSTLDFSAKRYRYTGKERDDETGLYYYGARYYAAWLGRWTSVDPGPEHNVYAYCSNAPVSSVDQDGRAAVPIDPNLMIQSSDAIRLQHAADALSEAAHSYRETARNIFDTRMAWTRGETTQLFSAQGRYVQLQMDRDLSYALRATPDLQDRMGRDVRLSAASRHNADWGIGPLRIEAGLSVGTHGTLDSPGDRKMKLMAESKSTSSVQVSGDQGTARANIEQTPAERRLLANIADTAAPKSDPVTRFQQRGQTMEAAAFAVAALTESINQWSVNSAIRQALEKLVPDIQNRLQADVNMGVLVTAITQVPNFPTEITPVSFAGLWLTAGASRDEAVKSYNATLYLQPADVKQVANHVLWIPPISETPLPPK
jgi:RHS repeat-associated protein